MIGALKYANESGKLKESFHTKNKITEGISRFAFTVSIGMAVGPFVGIQVQNHLNSRASFVSIFGITVAALIFVLFSRIKYPKIRKRKFSIKETIYKPALTFMFNMMFLMIPYGAVIAYSSILAQEKNLLGVLPYFYVCLVMGMLASKISTQKTIDSGKHLFLVCASLIILIFTMISYINLDSSVHLLIAGFLFGVGYGILQPLFQAFVTGTTPREKRGVANSTYMLSYYIGIGIGALFMGCVQEGIGLEKGFAVSSVAFVIGGVVFLCCVNKYYKSQKQIFETVQNNSGES